MNQAQIKAEYSRAWRLGMSVSQLRAFLDAHDRRCGICDKPEDPTKRGGGLVVDHDHACCGSQAPRVEVADRPKRLCGKCARGVLCVACNAAIGQFADQPDRLMRAIAYLAREIVPVAPEAQHDRRPRGQTHHKASFTEEAAKAARARYLAGGITQRELAAECGVSVSSIERLIAGRTYTFK